MRNLLFVILVGASACGARATTSTLPMPATHYDCGEAEVVHEAGALLGAGPILGNGRDTRLGWHDSEGDHYVAFPLATTDVEATEFVVPSDPRQDAVRKTYDTRQGSSTADWRLLSHATCTAKGGYSDVLGRYMKGATLEEIQAELALGSRDEARGIIKKAMAQLQKKYWKDL